LIRPALVDALDILCREEREEEGYGRGSWV
jgi:hypothetical protein